MLGLKLLLVPCFLLLLSLAGKYFGPRVAGWLAGLPVVAGPILFVLALENGKAFAASAATAATAAVLASVSFSLAYAHAAQRAAWPKALAAALMAWGLAAAVLAGLPSTPWLSLAIALCTLWLAPAAFPASGFDAPARHLATGELVLRMVAGAALTVGVAEAAGALGSAWSGLLAVFPVLGIVLAVFSHRSEGAAFAAALLRAMATGLLSFTAFCATLSFALPWVTITSAFASATAAALAVQLATKRRLQHSRRAKA